MKNIRRWFQFKETKIAVLVTLCNMELVVIPFILKGFLGLEGLTLKIVAGSWATAELSFWYWFSGWAFKIMKESESIKEVALIINSVGKEEFMEVRNITFVQRLDEWIYEHIVSRFDPENSSHKKLFVFLKGLGYVSGLLAIFVVSIFPVIWFVPFTICRWADWKVGISFVFVANFLRNVCFAEAWDHIWVLF